MLCFQPLALWCQGLRPQLWAQLVAEGSGVRRELRDCCSCSEHECVFSRAKGISLLQAAVLAQGVLPGAARSAAAPPDLHLKWG